LKFSSLLANCAAALLLASSTPAFAETGSSAIIDLAKLRACVNSAGETGIKVELGENSLYQQYRLEIREGVILLIFPSGAVLADDNADGWPGKNYFNGSEYAVDRDQSELFRELIRQFLARHTCGQPAAQK
jgi:hypothetical protein